MLKPFKLVSREFYPQDMVTDVGGVKVGGGTTTDTAGFASLTFMRGIPFNLISTTLLGMVDASIGGKFVINFKDVKNSIGSFGKPDVYVNPLFEYIEANIERLLRRDIKCMNEMIGLCVKDKLEICRLDPFDKGIRHILNFGHTIAYAIESESNNEISHGHAVAVGMIAESQKFNSYVFERIKSLVEKLNFDDVELFNLDKWIKADKKRQGENIQIPIVDEIGKSHVESVKITMFGSKAKLF